MGWSGCLRTIEAKLVPKLGGATMQPFNHAPTAQTHNTLALATAPTVYSSTALSGSKTDKRISRSGAGPTHPEFEPQCRQQPNAVGAARIDGQADSLSGSEKKNDKVSDAHGDCNVWVVGM